MKPSLPGYRLDSVFVTSQFLSDFWQLSRVQIPGFLPGWALGCSIPCKGWGDTASFPATPPHREHTKPQQPHALL